jgi:putative hydrolase of the HAD superfamily
MPKVIVFDLDDTLYPEREFVFSGFRAVAEWLNTGRNAGSFFEIACELFNNGARGNIFDLALEKGGIARDPELIGRLLKVYREHKPVIALYSDAKQALNDLRSDFKLGLITDGYLTTQQNKVKALGIEDYFSRIVYTDLYGREYWKPHAKPYDDILQSFGCIGGDCVYIADNPRKDFITARKLGWKTIRVRRNEGEHCRISLERELEADVEVNDLFRIREFLFRENTR